MLARSRASQISGRTPSSLKVVRIFGFASVLVGPCGRLPEVDSNRAHASTPDSAGRTAVGGAKRVRRQLLAAARCASVYRYAARMTESPAPAVAFADSAATGPPWSTCSARSRTARCRRSSGWPRTPSWRRRWRTRWRSRRWPAPSSATSSRLRERLDRARGGPVRGDGAVPEADRRVPRADRAVRLARGPGQGVRRRRAGRATSTARSPRMLDVDTRDLILEALDDTGHSEFAVDRVRRRSRPTPGSPAGWRCGAAG